MCEREYHIPGRETETILNLVHRIFRRTLEQDLSHSKPLKLFLVSKVINMYFGYFSNGKMLVC